jgi:hypothetical protein
MKSLKNLVLTINKLQHTVDFLYFFRFKITRVHQVFYLSLKSLSKLDFTVFHKNPSSAVFRNIPGIALELLSLVEFGLGLIGLMPEMGDCSSVKNYEVAQFLRKKYLFDE